MNSTIIWKTARLDLREVEPSDFDAIHAYASDPEVTAHMVWGPNTPAGTLGFIEQCARERERLPRADWTLAMVERDLGNLVGVCSIHIECPEHKNASIGYVVCRGAWGNGYASEAARALVDLGFQRLHMHRIWATCRPGNIASAKVLQKIGMRIEGRMRHHVFIRGTWQDSLLFAIVDELAR